MKTSSEVTADKLRGGFYSPAPLVKVCLDRAAALLRGVDGLRVLEPSAGDGAFLDGLNGHVLGRSVESVTAVEILGREASTCGSVVDAASFNGEVVHDSVLAWALRNKKTYDLAIGNPPFVRFQFVDPEERPRTLALGARLGAEFKGVSNLWLPVLVAAIGNLRPGGAFAFIVPAECFTGVSGHEVREWLLRRTETLDVDLFSPGSFPGVLQEVVVLSGRVVEDNQVTTRSLHMREHGPTGKREWTHHGIGSFRTWTRFLLTPAHVACIEAAAVLPTVKTLGDVARFEVATVTGANSFFCVNNDIAQEFGLGPWTRPLLPRTRYATGLEYTLDDHQAVGASGASGSLLDFSSKQPDPMAMSRAREYLERGEQESLHTRFKCRIREPWYRVPVVAPGVMLMAKRSHLFPRVIVNKANVVTTDTIYRGRLLSGAGVTARGFTAAFHNSLTLLTAEIEGRSFGGGVLELVPSEISRLQVPVPDCIEEEFDHLDWICRSGEGEESSSLVDETDALVVKKTPALSKDSMDVFRDALTILRSLRLERN